jgi:hypothetical protein
MYTTIGNAIKNTQSCQKQQYTHRYIRGNLITMNMQVSYVKNPAQNEARHHMHEVVPPNDACPNRDSAWFYGLEQKQGCHTLRFGVPVFGLACNDTKLRATHDPTRKAVALRV